jgi:hypothetical protein
MMLLLLLLHVVVVLLLLGLALLLILLLLAAVLRMLAFALPPLLLLLLLRFLLLLLLCLLLLCLLLLLLRFLPPPRWPRPRRRLGQCVGMVILLRVPYHDSCWPRSIGRGNVKLTGRRALRVASRGAACAASPPAPPSGRSPFPSAPPALSVWGLLPEADASRGVCVRFIQVSLCVCRKSDTVQANPAPARTRTYQSSRSRAAPCLAAGLFCLRVPAPVVVRCEASEMKEERW